MAAGDGRIVQELEGGDVEDSPGVYNKPAKARTKQGPR